MGKEEERRYFDMLSDAQLAHARGKPFSDNLRGCYFIDIGEILCLLPPPPARLLDLGCGTGWTCRFYARCGYDVTGLDLSPRAIEIAASPDNPGNPRFVVGDFESMDYRETFECAVSYDSLHHCESEQRTIAGVYRALVPGGRYIISETGMDHASAPFSREVRDKYGVVEKDMPPTLTVPLLRGVGFRRIEMYPRLKDFVIIERERGWRGKLVRLFTGESGLQAARQAREIIAFLRGHRAVVVAYR